MNISSRAAIWIAAMSGLAVVGCEKPAAETRRLPREFERWSVVEDLRIGSIDDPEQSLTSIGNLAVAPDGRLFIGQPQDGVVRVFDAEGSSLGSIGGPGQGPGEFERLYRIGLLADTLYASDLTSRRVTLFSVDGDLLAAFTVRAAVDPPFSPAAPFALFGDGTAVVTLGVPPDVPSEQLRRIPFLRVDRRGRTLDTIAFQSLEGMWRPTIEAPGGRLVAGGLQPFADDPFVMFFPDGRKVIEVERRAAERAQGASFRATVTGVDGDTVFSNTYDYEPVALPPDAADSAIAESARIRARYFPTVMAAEAALRATTYVPSYFPPVTDVEFSADGDVWLRREDRSDGSQSWLVLDEWGNAVAEATLPPGLDVQLIQTDILWAVVLDELDVPYVVRYRITSP